MNNIFDHVQGHVSGAFRPKLLPTQHQDTSGSTGPAVGDGLLMESGSFLLLESGDYILLE